MRKLLTLLAAMAMFVTVFAVPAVADDDDYDDDDRYEYEDEMEEQKLPSIFEITQDRNFVDRNGADFDILNIALRVTDLDEAVKAGGLTDITVFAPTDQAFKDAAGVLCGNRFARSEFRALICLVRTLGVDGISTVVQNHVVAGVIPAEAAIASVGGTVFPILDGSDGLDVVETGEGVGIGLEFGDSVFGLGGTANIVAVDIFASNGVVHVVDAVLVP